MKMKKHFLAPLLAACLCVVLFSCNDNKTESAKEESKMSETTTTATTATAPAPTPTVEAAFVPFKVMVIKHTVADFDKWKPAYLAHDSVRKAYGLTDLDLVRGMDNPNKVIVVEKISDLQQAKDFSKLPNLKEAMKKGGVKGTPEFSYWDVVRHDDSKIDTKDMVVVTHKVKDFDAWVKVYDEEGKATRANEGMVDRVMARNVDDPNMVHLVFAVTDMAKAKAAITSEAKKKLMMSAGVEGKPVIEFYKKAD
jgi:quinol monooxygenase YgiN